MYRLSKDFGIVTMTPTMAQAYLKTNTYEGQRLLNKVKVEYYRKLMIQREFRPFEVSIAKIVNTQDVVLVNGQHCLTAVCLTENSHKAIVSTWLCDDYYDVAKLYATFDVHSTRTQSACMKAARVGMDQELKEVPMRVLESSGSALYYLEQKRIVPTLNVQPLGKMVKSDFVQKNPTEVLFVARYSENRNMLRVGVVCAIIASIRVSDFNVAMDFWDAINTGASLGINDPRLQCREKICSPYGRKDGRNGIINVFNICASYWNTWRTGGQRRSVKLNAIKNYVEMK